MNIFILFAQRIGSYPGEFLPEIIAAMTEYGLEDLEALRLDTRNKPEFKNAAIFKFELTPEQVNKIIETFHAPISL